MVGERRLASAGVAERTAQRQGEREHRRGGGSEPRVQELPPGASERQETRGDPDQEPRKDRQHVALEDHGRSQLIGRREEQHRGVTEHQPERKLGPLPFTAR